MTQKPFILINFKTYPNATGEHAVKLAKICEEAAKEKPDKAIIAVAVQAADIFRVKQAVSIPVFAQHTDPTTQGQGTGAITAEAIKAAGAAGTLINHSEKQVPIETIKSTIERCRTIGLTTVICANDASIAHTVAKFHPDFVAVEPPELIGGDISVSTAKPELISDSVRNVQVDEKAPQLLVGAGVKVNADLSLSLKLGAKGILLASGITKAQDPKKALSDLMG